MATLYLIPCPIAEDSLESISLLVKSIVLNTQYFVVERAKTTRRFFKSIDKSMNIDALHIFELDKENPMNGLGDFLKIMNQGKNVGILSEAGCPAIADPGNMAVAWAHQNGHLVNPLSGPSSIILALIASGFNGQQFIFHGYLPNKKPELLARLKLLETSLSTQPYTHIFMEAPYRNVFMVESCIASLNPNTMLCIACDLESDQQMISTKKINEWKNFDISSLHKRPCVYLLGKWEK